jgi:hypothetical protein
MHCRSEKYKKIEVDFAGRDKNRERLRVKNIIAEKLGCPVIEFKKDHRSE